MQAVTDQQLLSSLWNLGDIAVAVSIIRTIAVAFIRRFFFQYTSNEFNDWGWSSSEAVREREEPLNH